MCVKKVSVTLGRCARCELTLTGTGRNADLDSVTRAIKHRDRWEQVWEGPGFGTHECAPAGGKE